MSLEQYLNNNIEEIFPKHANPLLIKVNPLGKSFFKDFGKSDSFVLDVLSADKSYSYFGKSSSKVEYSILKELWNKGYNNSEIYKIPEPIAFVNNYDILLMEKVQGQNLKSIILNDIFSINHKVSNSLIKNLERSVDWLVHFEKFIYERKSRTAHSFLGEMRSDLKGIKLPPRFTKKIRSELSNFGDIKSRIPVKFSNRNYRSRDILVNDHEVIRLDWNGWKADELVIFIEASSFICELNTFKKYPLANKRKIKLIREIFLRLYFSKTIFKDYRHFFPLVQLYFNVWILKRLLRNYTIEKNYFRKKIIRQRITNHINIEFSV